MSRTLRVAVTQMDMAPAPTGYRLERADHLASDAETNGLDLLVLPAFFNTGYGYQSELLAQAESPDGPTMRWMRNTARQLQIYVAGSMLITEQKEIYHALLLFSPQGKSWRYDQIFPWGFERSIFRPTRVVGLDRAVIARTNLGNLGFLLGWDAAHLDLWTLYGGRVDALIIPTAMPLITQGDYMLSNRQRLHLDSYGPILRALKGIETSIMGSQLDATVTWMRIPAFISGGCGTLETPLPRARSTLTGIGLVAPMFFRHWRAADHISLHTSFAATARVVTAGGKELRCIALQQGETYRICEVALPDTRPRPINPMPANHGPHSAFWLSDILLPRLMEKSYRDRLRALNLTESPR